MALLGNHPVAIAVGVLATAYFVRFFYHLVQWRKRFRNLPGPPHNFLLGHLISMGTVVQKLPKRVHPHVFPHYLTEEFKLPPVFYLDCYPINESMLVILDPEIAQEVTTDRPLLKHPALREALKPLAGKENLVSSDGNLWKKWRTVFNPAFSVQHLMSQVPIIVECAEKFAEILDGHASKNQVFRMEEEATKVTIDVIGKAICDHDFGYLFKNDNEFVTVMRKTLSWMPDTQSINPFHRKNPLRTIMFKYYKYRMDTYIGRILDERFSGREANQQTKGRKKSGIDLALQEYFKETGQDADSKIATMDAEFRRNAIDNLLALLFAGHDTTASTICYSYYLLDQNPNTLVKIRQEIDDVFGVGANIGEELKKEPYLINKCNYTLAVVKETLRLWSPASSVRQGRKGYFIKDPTTGNMLPTEDMLVWPVPMGMHRNSHYWEDAHMFKPERFMPENVDKQVPNSYRPFEKGPRNCIGQELALIEMKVVLALTVREFDIKGAYDEVDALAQDGTLWAKETSWKTGPQEIFDDPAYQVLLAAAKPREGMPMRVSRRTV